VRFGKAARDGGIFEVKDLLPLAVQDPWGTRQECCPPGRKTLIRWFQAKRSQRLGLVCSVPRVRRGRFASAGGGTQARDQRSLDGIHLDTAAGWDISAIIYMGNSGNGICPKRF
jgi:hypothetical protein